MTNEKKDFKVFSNEEEILSIDEKMDLTKAVIPGIDKISEKEIKELEKRFDNLIFC